MSKNNDQMTLFNDQIVKKIDSDEIVDLFMSGLFWLEKIGREEQTVNFSKWAETIKSARKNDSALTFGRLEWLWEAITSEPTISNHEALRIINLDEEWKNIAPIKCLKENSRFGIFLKHSPSFDFPGKTKIKGMAPNAEATIKGPLLMRAGKARRLECCDVPTVLSVHLPKAGSQEDEAAAFKVDVKEIELEAPFVRVSVKSLNHAFTKASLRLQPHRRSHGGKMYNHVALRLKDNLYEPLEEIRRRRERQIWTELKGEVDH
jgi:hypothetical protein